MHLLKILVTVTLLGPAAAAQAGASSDPYASLKVTMLYDSQGSGYSDATRNQVAMTLLRSLDYGLLRSAGRATYGRGAGFARGPAPGPVSGFLTALSDASLYVGDQYRNELGAALKRDPTPGDWTFVFETIVSPEAPALPAVEERVVPPHLRDMWTVTKATFLEGVSDADLAAQTERVTQIPFAAKADLADHGEALLRAGNRTLAALNTDATKFAFLPVYLRFVVTVSQATLRVSMEATLKPGELNITDQKLLNPAPDSTPFHVEKIWSRPFQAADDRTQTAMKIRLQQAWGDDGVAGFPIAAASWGTLVNGDLREVRTCAKDCQDLYTYIPNIMIKLTPSALLKDAPSDGRVKQLRNAIARAADERQRKVVTMHVLFNQLVFDVAKMSSPTLPAMIGRRARELGVKSLSKVETAAVTARYESGANAVIGALSSTPVLIKMTEVPADMSTLGALVGQTTTDPVRYHYVVIGRGETIDEGAAFAGSQSLLSDYWIKRNEIKAYNYAVVRIYDTLVGPMLAQQVDANLKPMLKEQLTAADQQVGQALGGTFGPVVQLFH